MDRGLLERTVELVRATKVPDLYNRVVLTYANVLVPLRPQIHIPIPVRS
jgi:hypothetical protein